MNFYEFMLAAGCCWSGAPIAARKDGKHERRSRLSASLIDFSPDDTPLKIQPGAIAAPVVTGWLRRSVHERTPRRTSRAQLL